MNVVAIIGRLTRDPELRHTQSGKAVCQMRVAIDRAGDPDGDGGYKAGFFDLEAWERTAELCAEHLSKGRQVAFSGRLKHHEWEADDGTKRSQVLISVTQMMFVGSRDGEQTDAGASGQFVPAGQKSDYDDGSIPF